MSDDPTGEITDIYLPIQLMDVEPGEALDFDTYVFLPTNGKYVIVSRAGEYLDTNKIEKISKNKINKLFVSAEQAQRFYTYSAAKLRRFTDSDKLTPEERTKKLISSVRYLMEELFSPLHEDGVHASKVFRNCNEIVSSYIQQGVESDWFLRVQETLAELGEQYCHSGNVSTLAALFSIGTCIGKPEHLALAGLLHDVGESQLEEIQSMDPEMMTPEQRAKYQTHPQCSVELLAKKKIGVSENVLTSILQHHESFNGSGFPSGLVGEQVSLEAQILAFADQFEKLTRSRGSMAALSPLEAVRVLKKEQTEDPSQGKYHPALLKDLLYLLPV